MDIQNLLYHPIISFPKLKIPFVIQLIAGDMIIPANPVIHNTTNIIENICSLFTNHSFALYGKNGIIIFDPSNGGNGIKLKTPKPILVDIVADINNIIIPPTVEDKNPTPANL